jgi:hypothetical protein
LKNPLILFALLAASVGALSQERSTEAITECKYVMDQAQAQRDLLRTPTAYSGLTQPESGLSPEFVFGLTQSLSNEKKARITMEVARTNCDLYFASTEAQKKIYFALPSISKAVLQHRLGLIDNTIAQLDQMIAEEMKKVEAQDMTRPAIYSLQAAKLHLVSDRTATLTGITSPYVPPQNDQPLNELVEEKRTFDLANQRAINRLQKQNSWDVSVVGGVFHEVGSSSLAGQSSSGLYGAFNVSYNLGSKSASRHLDASLSAYDEWQKAQFDDVAYQAEILRRQILDTIAVQQSQLDALTHQAEEIDQNLRLIGNSDTVAATAYRNQLTADRLVLKVDYDDIAFRIAQLDAFLRANFQTAENNNRGHGSSGP